MVNVEVIGLCLLVMNGTGFMAILPDWDHGAWIPGKNLPNHYAVIAVMKDDIYNGEDGEGWTGEREFDPKGDGVLWKYFVIEGESVRFENVDMDEPMPSVPAKVPSLRRSCEGCVGISTRYLVSGSGAAAHVYFTRGEAMIRKVKTRVDTVVKVPLTANHLKINAGGSKVLLVKDGKTVIIANMSLHHILAGFPPPTGEPENHFLAYYKLASTWTGRRCRLPKYPPAQMGDVVYEPATLGAGCSNSQYP